MIIGWYAGASLLIMIISVRLTPEFVSIRWSSHIWTNLTSPSTWHINTNYHVMPPNDTQHHRTCATVFVSILYSQLNKYTSHAGRFKFSPPVLICTATPPVNCKKKLCFVYQFGLLLWKRGDSRCSGFKTICRSGWEHYGAVFREMFSFLSLAVAQKCTLGVVVHLLLEVCTSTELSRPVVLWKFGINFNDW